MNDSHPCPAPRCTRTIHIDAPLCFRHSYLAGKRASQRLKAQYDLMRADAPNQYADALSAALDRIAGAK